MPESSTRKRRAVRASRVNERELLSVVSCRSVELQQTISSAVTGASTLRQFETATIRALKGYPGVVASIWNYVSDGECRLGDLRLQGPAFEREDVQQWLATASVRATQDATQSISACPVIGNLCGVLIPTSRPDGAFDVLAILVTHQGQEQLLSTMHAGQLISRGLMLWHSAQDAARRSADLRTTAAVVELCARVTCESTPEHACIAAVNSLQEYLGCEQAFIGLVETGRSKTSMAAISGMARIDRHSATLRMMNAVLDESVVRQEPAIWPVSSAQQQQQLLAHQQFGRHAGAGSLCSIPLWDHSERIVAVVVLVFSGATMAQDHELLAAALSRPLGAAVGVMQRTRRAWPVRLWRRVISGNPAFKLAAAVLCIVAVTAVLLFPVPYRIPCRLVVEAVQRQYSVAPYDGLLEAAFVKPGETVAAGQLMARMDGRELHWQLAATQAESERADRERDVHLVDREVARSYMSALESSKLQSEAQLIQHRLNSLEIRSPITGVVLSGSVDRRENVPVRTGELLFEVAPVDRLRFEVAIPASEAACAAEGQTVHMRIDGQADQVLEGTIARIRPRSEIVDSRNVFVAEVELNNLEQMSLRPGMQGAARVVTSPRPLGWNWFHRAWEYVVKNILW
ncbi:MAG: HlyD family efflux transporter periplasmic adaptor subunit [Planctomycetaceae bacterium]|nr:HlyD family efflux transporter periplasmic adaptor subunit [Planctomycetaceae bacterium]